MTLFAFLEATSETPARELRQAMVVALGTLPERSPRGYAYFYRRVIEVLGRAANRTPDTEHESATRDRVPTA